MTQSIKPKTVLLVEDEEALSNALSLKLKSVGYEVTTAENGDKGLKLIKKNSYDIVLLDIITPVKNGFEVLEDIKKANLKVNVIALSNLGQPEDLDKAMKLGAKDFLVKSESTLLEIIDKVNKAV